MNTAAAISIRKLGIVARDYNVRFPNKYRDFTYTLPGVLALLDEKGCDAVLFSLYSIIPRTGYDILPILPDYANLKLIGVEEFTDSRRGRKVGDYVAYYRAHNVWEEHRFQQAFGQVNWQAQTGDVRRFAQEQIPQRIFGNCCFIVCGETNGVKYDKKDSRGIIDLCGVREAIPAGHIILNPVHDKMTRFEMMMKRRFLSEGGRFVVSVWNRGKKGSTGKSCDGPGSPWTVFKDGCLQNVSKVDNGFGVEVGIVSIA